jgi:hypothetical protein
MAIADRAQAEGEMAFRPGRSRSAAMVAVAGAMLLGGCTLQQQGAAVGAGGGCAVGAGIGALAGGRNTGTAAALGCGIGAMLGGIGGAVVGSNLASGQQGYVATEGSLQDQQYAARQAAEDLSREAAAARAAERRMRSSLAPLAQQVSAGRQLNDWQLRELEQARADRQRAEAALRQGQSSAAALRQQLGQMQGAKQDTGQLQRDLAVIEQRNRELEQHLWNMRNGPLGQIDA